MTVLIVNLADSKITVEKILWRILLVVLITMWRPYTVGGTLSRAVREDWRSWTELWSFPSYVAFLPEYFISVQEKKPRQLLPCLPCFSLSLFNQLNPAPFVHTCKGLDLIQPLQPAHLSLSHALSSPTQHWWWVCGHSRLFTWLLEI